jgi:hypothetical protein
LSGFILLEALLEELLGSVVIAFGAGATAPIGIF